ncbi:MAG: IIA-like nitrogen-regulatory protein [Devosia sp.]|uniref:PTS sugar transporter subunit IIA n=1 Tax=Devosia sp. TaxID=1871048 RepID=UPI0026239E10|nr:PTS sugar transporter subunit IIA [Devosia sp.]MDB5586408.1 IIA-like nitrogen-regulatory protein [Devosia sp.]
MPISEFLAPEHVLVDHPAPSKQSVIEALSSRAAAWSGVDANVIFIALNNREQLGSTGMGQGIAIPHATVAGLAKPMGLLARLAKPVDFDAIDEGKVDIVFVLLIPVDDRAAGLKLLSAAARVLRSEEARALIRAAPDGAALYEAISRAYGAQSPG